ncbi:MAG: hypothetical protein Q4B26_08880 [Eubacteriales bacterium]|nr:hypothetical protein [Eubacteriales bacterium]
MAKAWDYSELSKLAKEAGGPEQLLSTIEENARADGRSEMLPVILIVGAGCTAIGYGINKAKNYFANKRQMRKHKIENAKEELIKGMTEVDINEGDEE